MPKKSTTKDAKKRVKIKNLPAAEAKLTEKQMKKVKGGAISVVGTGGTAKTIITTDSHGCPACPHPAKLS